MSVFRGRGQGDTYQLCRRTPSLLVSVRRLARPGTTSAGDGRGIFSHAVLYYYFMIIVATVPVVGSILL
eukprot:COSAG02_NODE_380_length_23483_cov_8.034382_17_plen_69_part_00